MTIMCEKCGNIMNAVTAGYVCSKCDNRIDPFSLKDQIKIIPTVPNNTTIENNNKIYTLVYTKKDYDHDEQYTYLIDEENKIYFSFYDDGYEGDSTDFVKCILNFLGIKYFECVYNKLPDNKYKDYKLYNWRVQL